MPYPELSLELLSPSEMTAPEVVGASIEGGRTQNGIGPVVDVSGGGFVMVKYGGFEVEGDQAGTYRYVQELMALLSGTRNAILVPLITEMTAPYVPGEHFGMRGLPHSDGTFFSDGTGYAQQRIYATAGAAAALNAGTMTIDVARGATIRGGMWFEIEHPTKSCRAYVIRSVDSTTTIGAVTRYVVSIRPTLREAVTAGTTLRFERPRCLMRAQNRISMSVSGWRSARPEIQFIEAFS